MFRQKLVYVPTREIIIMKGLQTVDYLFNFMNFHAISKVTVRLSTFKEIDKFRNISSKSWKCGYWLSVPIEYSIKRESDGAKHFLFILLLFVIDPTPIASCPI